MSARHLTRSVVATGLTLAIVFSGSVAASAEPQRQQDAGGITAFPTSPTPSASFDWLQRAKDYDTFVYDWTDRGPYTTISSDTTGLNMPAGQNTTYKMPAYYGDTRVSGTTGDGTQEAVNQIASVVGATLVGIDKSDQSGYNYVDMLRTFYHPDLGVAMDTPSSASTAPGSGSIWYTTVSNVLYYMLGDQYPDATDMTDMLRSIADKYYSMVSAVGGENADFTMQDFDFATDSKVAGRNEGGEAAVGAAAILLWAHSKFGDARYLQGAQWAMDALERSSSNLYYEVTPILAPYLAARLNAETNSSYDIQKYLRWLVQDSNVRSGWGTITGTWGGKDVSGLSGSRTDTGGYAFAMNSFATPLLAATAKYDSRYANLIGQWMLNIDNAARFFYADQMPADQQYYGSTYISDPAHVIAYEGLMKTGSQGIQARGDVPERSGSWGVGEDATSLGLYGSSWVGFMGASLAPTNVAGVVRTDLNALDFFGDNTNPTYLYYNPNSTPAAVDIELDSSHDLYDSVSDTVLATAVSGTTTVTVPAGGSVVLVELPSNSRRGVSGTATTFDGVPVSYDRSPTRNLALGGTATSSSSAAGSNAAAVVDGSAATEWTAGSASPETLVLDLGGSYSVSEVRLDWGRDHASTFTAQTSTDGQTWSTATTTTGGLGGVESTSFAPVQARYLRIELTTPASPGSAYTLRELGVYAGDLAAQAPVTVSSTANTLNIPANLTDGSSHTRWESDSSDPQWAAVDLGSPHQIGSVRLTWEAAAAKSYELQTSEDGDSWLSVYSTTSGTGGTQTIALPEGTTGRFVRMQATQRLTNYAYSLFAVEVYEPTGDRSEPALYGSSTAIAGSALSVTGRGFASSETVTFAWDNGDSTTAIADASGTVVAEVTVPSAGSRVLSATGSRTGLSATLAVVVSAVDGGNQAILTLSSDRVTAGGQLTASVVGLTAGTSYSVWLDSTPTELARAVAGIDGTLSVDLRIPVQAEVGAHRVTVKDAQGDVASAALTVDAATPGPSAGSMDPDPASDASGNGPAGLASTGANLGPSALMALAVLALGALTLLLARRPRRRNAVERVGTADGL
jgi:hypothetical protein